jgi:tetratricopeptide (TPR) repeat protein
MLAVPGCRQSSRQWIAALILAAVILFAPSPVKAGGPSWIELRTPHFIIVSNGSESQARETAKQFETIHAVFTRFFLRARTASQPVHILAVKDEKTFKSLLPEFYEQKNAAERVGVYLGGTDTEYIVIRIDEALSKEQFEPFEAIYHEYVHYLTRQLITTSPLWLTEGLAEYFGNTRIESKQVVLGAYSTSHYIVLQQHSLLPVETLFQVDSNSPYYNESTKTSVFYAESWALTHYLFEQDNLNHTHHMADLLRQLDKGVDPDTAVAQCLGDPKELDAALRKYAHKDSVMASHLPLPAMEESAFQIRPVSDAESKAIRADFLAHDHHFDTATQMLQEALQADPKLGIAYETLAFIAAQQGHLEEVRKQSAQAVALNPESGRANLYYAGSLLEGASDEAARAKAETSLRIAIKNAPDYTPAYSALAYALTVDGGKEKVEEAYMTILQAIDREPGNVQYRLQAVDIFERRGRPADAVRIAKMAVNMAQKPEERQAAEQSLEQAQRYQEQFEQAKANKDQPPPQMADVVPPGGGAGVTYERRTIQFNASASMQVLSDTGGVDFTNYLQNEVLAKVQAAWPVEVLKTKTMTAAKPGSVVVEFAITKDGTATGISVKRLSPQPLLDHALETAIASSSPFKPLPAKYKGDSLRLQLQCEYLVDSETAKKPEPGGGKQ